MTTIWAVSHGEYSNYCVDAVFESKADAERFATERTGPNPMYGETYRTEEIGFVPAGTLGELTRWVVYGTAVFADGSEKWTHASRWSCFPAVENERAETKVRPEGSYVGVRVAGPDDDKTAKRYHDAVARAKAEFAFFMGRTA